MTRKNQHLERPAPSDFAEHAITMTERELCAHYRTGPYVVRRWRDETGVKRDRMRAMPDDFVAVAKTMTIEQLMRHYRARHSLVKRWLSDIGHTGEKRLLRAPVPADFLAQCKMNGKTRLRAVYQCSERQIEYWLEQAGDQARALVAAAGARAMVEAGRRNAAMQKAARAAAAKDAPKHNPVAMKPTGWKLPLVKDAQTSAVTRADQAMRWLQRKVPYCYPLRVTCGGNIPGYRMLSRVWQADELIAEAERRGWQPDAWRSVAA
jgi:hypothetical protein